MTDKLTPEEYINAANSPKDRRMRKVLMFPWLYGASPDRLLDVAKAQGIGRIEAQKILDDFNSNFKEVTNAR